MSPIDKSRWQAISALLDELIDATPDVRAQRLEQLRSEQPQLAEDLEALLVEQGAVQRGGFLEGAVLSPLGAALPGEVVDRYTLERQIGEGGMGAVWLARRSDGRYEGEVAIKFLSLPTIGPAGVRRFEREGRLLARLKHPNIAHLLDAGVTASGCPYLVLEYVQGESLDQWCRSRSLDVRSRIELFLQVLAAVSHAHGKLILHRDLKPANILVTVEGQVKLLDFGIAKLLDEDGAADRASEMTQAAGRAFTLDYAAPEQLQGGEVTTATDVYSLGVILYVVLTGEHPTAYGATTPAERLQALVHTEPRRPSAVVAKSDSGRGVVGLSQRVRALRGDLDNIVAKALKKASAERYPTVDAFAQDLRRYLRNEPVSARGDSTAYRLRKFVVRHAVPVTAAAAVMVATAAAAIVSLQQAREATLQRDRALALSARNAAVVDFVSGMLTEVASDDQPIRLSELLERSQQILLASNADPEHQAAILDVLADYHLSAGDPASAQPLLERSRELTAGSADVALRAALLCDHAYAISLLNQQSQALREVEEGIALSRIDPLAAARCLQKRAFIAQNSNDPENALKYAMAAQAALREAPVRKPDQEASLLGDVAYAHYLSGRTAEADRYFAQALARYQELGRAASPATFSIRNNWGIASFAAGDNRRALENYEEALRIAQRRNPGGEAPGYLLSNRALALASLARYPEAIEAFEAVLRSAERTNNMASRLHALVNRAGTYLAMNDVARAERELAMVEAQFAAAIPPDSVPAVTIQHLKGRIATLRGDLPEAQRQLSAAIRFFDERQMSVAPVTRALNARSEVHLLRGDVSSARIDAQRSLEISRKLQDAKPHSSLTGAALLQLSQVERAAGDIDDARRLAAEALQHLRETLGAEHPDTARAMAAAGARDV